MFRRGAAAAIIVFLLGILSATPALALPTIDPAVSVYAATDYDKEMVTPDTDVGQLLPINRWAPSMTNVHTRRGFDPGTMLLAGQETIGSFFMAWGGACYSWAGTLVGLASITDVTQAGSAELDKIAAGIGKALTGDAGKGSIAAAVIVLVLAASAWTARREGVMAIIRQMIPRVAVLALISVMIGGAMASTGGGRDGTPYIPGKMSPAWITAQLNKTLHTISDMALTEPMRYISEARRNTKDSAHCDSIMAGMHKEYLDKTSRTKPGAVIPLAMSMVWEQSGPKAWSAIQFGAHKDSQVYAEKSWCHLAEARTGKPPSEHRKIAQLGGVTPPGGSDSLAFSNLSNNDIDQATIGWAACAGNGTDWRGTDKDAVFFDNDRKTGGGLSKACQKWWATGWKPSTGGVGKAAKNTAAKIPGLGALMDLLNVDSDSRFDWWQDPGTIRKQIPAPGVSEYIVNLHGLGTSVLSVTVGVTYALSSTLVLLVFAALAFGVIASKMVLFIMSLAIFAMLVATLFPNVNTSEKLKQVCKGWVSFALIASIALAVMSVLIVITKAVIALGENMLADYPLGLILWTGASPALAVFALNIVFKKIFKLPSIFKPSGMLAWAGSAAGMGTMALGGAAAAKRIGSQLVRKVASTRTVRESAGAFKAGATGRKDAGASLTLGSKVAAKHKLGEGGVSPYRVPGAAGGGMATAAGSVPNAGGAVSGGTTSGGVMSGGVTGGDAVSGAGLSGGVPAPVTGTPVDGKSSIPGRAGGETINMSADSGSTTNRAGLPVDSGLSGTTVSAPDAGLGGGAAVDGASVARPGWLETQRMRMEMNPDSHSAVFASDVQKMAGVLRAGVGQVREKGWGGALSDVAPVRAIRQAQARREAYKSGVLERPSGRERLASGARTAWAGVKTTGRVVGTGIDRVSRLPRVAGVGVRGMLKGASFAAGAVVKAAGVTVAGSMIPGVGPVAGPMMGLSSLRKSFERAREASRGFREQTAGEYAGFQAGKLGIPGVPGAGLIPGVRQETAGFGIPDGGDGKPSRKEEDWEEYRRFWKPGVGETSIGTGNTTAGKPETKGRQEEKTASKPENKQETPSAGTPLMPPTGTVGRDKGKPEVPDAKKSDQAASSGVNPEQVRAAQAAWLANNKPTAAPPVAVNISNDSKGTEEGKPGALNSLADMLEESAQRDDAEKQKLELEEAIKKAAQEGQAASTTRDGKPGQNTGDNQPVESGTPQEDSQPQPAPETQAQYAPEAPPQSTPETQPESEPTPKPEPQPESAGETQPTPEPTPQPVLEPQPAAQPGPESQPVDQQREIGEAAGIPNEISSAISRTVARAKTRKPPNPHTNKPQV